MRENADNAIDDAGRLTLATGFDFDALDGETESPDQQTEPLPVAFSERQAAARLLEVLTSKASPKLAGQRAYILAHALKLGSFKTQRALASKLHISPGRVSQILNVLKRALAA